MNKSLKHSPPSASVPDGMSFGQAFTGRLVSALPLIVVIFSLAIWITGFLLLKNGLSNGGLASSIITDLTCLTFFGGLTLSVFLGAVAGNILRRFFWKIMANHRVRAEN